MAPVDVTVLYGQNQQADLCLPDTVPSQFLAEAVARALKLGHYAGKPLVFRLVNGEERKAISPAASLNQARVRAGAFLLLELEELEDQQAAYLVAESGVRFYLKASNLIGRTRQQPYQPVDLDLTALDLHKLSSHQHALLRLIDGRYLLADLGSKNGTFVNNQRLNPHDSYPLQDGDLLEFGPPPRGIKMNFVSK